MKDRTIRVKLMQFADRIFSIRDIDEAQTIKKEYDKFCLDNKVSAEQLEIKKVYFNQLGFAISCIRKIDEARSVSDKINLIINAHTSINNTIKFSSGKDDDSGQDEMTPIFQYIILKAHPKRMYSNISYIKCFLGENITDSRGFLLSQIESAASYIHDLNYEQLKMSKDEYDNRFNEAAIRHNFKIKSNSKL